LAKLTEPKPRLVVKGLSKRFAATRALDDVDLTILPGEVHGLLGENGSGKSTLIRILAGYHAPDAGELEVDGQGIQLPLTPGQFRSLGMAFVHQDLGLIPSLTVVENLRIGEIAFSRRRWHISWRRQRAIAVEIFRRYGVAMDPRQVVSRLTPVQRAELAIVRAMEGMRAAADPEGEPGDGYGRGVLILDEPTVFLPRVETERLFDLVREVANTGASVLFVSHDLDEVVAVTDRVTVLRDGRTAGTVVTKAADKVELVEMILGHRTEKIEFERKSPDRRATAASVRNLTGRGLQDVSMSVYQGEILGLTGLSGSGFEQVLSFIVGAERAERGELTLRDEAFDLTSMNPAQALSAGIALVPGDRQRDGSISSLTIVDNVMLQVLDAYFHKMVLRRRRMVAQTADLMRRFNIRPANPRLLYAALSGGNQQRALLAKWMQIQPFLLLLHEPTQGVDIGAREQIFALIRKAGAEGTAVICGSSDYEQLATICDRVVILSQGQTVHELVGAEITKERIAAECYQSASSF
jgi:ribose transport system ATP-binding protein